MRFPWGAESGCVIAEEGCANGACVPELDEKVIAQEDARVRSFAIAQVPNPDIASKFTINFL